MITKKIDVKAKLIHCNACNQNVTLPHNCPNIEFRRGLSHKPSHKPSHKSGELSITTIGDLIALANKLKNEVVGWLPPEELQDSDQMARFEQCMNTPIEFAIRSFSESVEYKLKRINKISKNILTGVIEIEADEGELQ